MKTVKSLGCNLIILLLIFNASTFVCNAQQYPRKEIDVNEMLETYYAVQDLDLNYEELYENVVQLLAEPIDLNTADVENLRFLKILSEVQLKNLLDYRNENGLFLSVYELQAVPRFDLKTIYQLIPFVTVNDPTTSLNTSMWNRVKKEGDHYFLVRYERTLQQKSGFESTQPNQQFLGSPDKIYMRFRTSKPGDFSFGFTAEKDAGEQINWNPSEKKWGADYLSFHAQVQNKGRLMNLIVGDYQNQFGQGLMLGGIFGMGKGGETITTTRRSNIGLLPYTSVYEANYLRGVAATVKLTPHLFLTGFYAQAYRDARLAQSDTTENNEVIQSFQQTGLHRNENELATRKKIREQNMGAVLQFKRNQLDVGLMYNHVSFSAPVVRPHAAYNQFSFQGIQNQNIGLYLNYTFQNITFFSEVSTSVGNGYARLVGVLWSLSPQLDIALVNRKYNRDFVSFYSNAFAENSTTQNESGTYWGWKYRFNKKFSTSGYVDLFTFPWLKYRSYAPSNGHEWLLRFMYQPSKTTSILLQAREESKIRNRSTDTNLYETAEGKKNNYWITFDYPIGQRIKLKSRAQFSTFKIDHRTTHGLALVQDIAVNLGKVEITARHALFDTEDFDNRQYVYERDVWLAYSLPAYDGTGVRNLVMIEYTINRTFTCWLRYTQTHFTNQTEIGSGADTIEGDMRTDIKFQIRIKF